MVYQKKRRENRKNKDRLDTQKRMGVLLSKLSSSNAMHSSWKANISWCEETSTIHKFPRCVGKRKYVPKFLQR